MTAQMTAPVSSHSATHDDAAELRRLFEAWKRSVEGRDLDGMLRHYADDVVLYDAIPPFIVSGMERYRQSWAGCMPHFPEKFVSEQAEPRWIVGQEVAVMHCLTRFRPIEPADHPAGQTWMRATVTYQKRAGRWEVVHEHVSVPFNPMTNQPVYLKDPAEAHTPVDWEGCAGDESGPQA